MNERSKKIIEIISLVIIFSLLFGYPIYFLVLNNSLDIKHETNRWALIVDTEGSKLAIEAVNSSVWERIVSNYQEFKDYDYPMVITCEGIVPYNNSWGFRIDPKTVKFLYGLIRGSTHTIKQLASNLDYYLNDHFGYIAIYIDSINFYYSKNAGTIPFTIDLIVTGVAILLVGVYFYFKREGNLSVKIKEALLIAKDNPEGISFTGLSQNVGLEQKRIERLVSKNNLKGDLGLHITNDCIEFKEIIYKKRISQIDEQLKDITQLTSDQITLEHFSKLAQFKNDLEEALVYYKDTSDIEKQTQINVMVEIINDLLESIPLERINK
ncbi:MAG: hypothetical protein ACTSO7_16685 [Candidatus Heimdallarchaeota archaeon]